MSPVISALPQWLIIAVLLAVLGTLLFATLRATGYPRTFAAIAAAIALAHPAFANPATGVVSLLFALAAYALAMSGLAFALSPDPRRTILLGSSLAGAQLVNPICGLLSAISMPLALRNVLTSGQTGRTLGQIVSLLFIPALVGGLLVSACVGQHESSVSLYGNSDARRASEAIVRSTIAVMPLAIWLFAVARKPACNREIIGGLCAIFIATGALDGFLGIGAGVDVTSAVGPLAVVVLSTAEPRDARASIALLLIVSGIAATWVPIDRLAGIAGA